MLILKPISTLTLSFSRTQRVHFLWCKVPSFNYFLCNFFAAISLYYRCSLCRYCLSISKINQLSYIVLVVDDIDFDNPGWLSKSLLWKSAPNELDLKLENPPLFDEKKSSLSNILCVLNNPPPILAPMPPEKNGSLSKEPNPLLPNPDELFFFSFLPPKNPLKKSSSNGYSS